MSTVLLIFAQVNDRPRESVKLHGRISTEAKSSLVHSVGHCVLNQVFSSTREDGSESLVALCETEWPNEHFKHSLNLRSKLSTEIMAFT